MKNVMFAFFVLVAAGPLNAMEAAEPLIFSLHADELEVRRGDGHSAFDWDLALGGGSDLHQGWLESRGERSGGVTGEHQLRLYYSRAVAPFWHVNLGWRQDQIPDPERNWLLLGLDGVAAFNIETGISLFVGNDGRSGLEIELEKDFMITQRWLIIAGASFDLHGHNDRETGAGSGLSAIETGFRLAYEVTPRLVPYVGVSWTKTYGKTARYLRHQGEAAEAAQMVLGVRFWR